MVSALELRPAHNVKIKIASAFFIVGNFRNVLRDAIILSEII
jgi:hypothetical protein